MARWLVLMLCGGCVVHTTGERRRVDAPVGQGPMLTFAEAEFESGWGDPYWRLEADVEVGDDPIDAVLMDLYDEACGCRVESIELFEEWTDRFQHDWHGSLEVFDPTYDRYVIEVWAFDTAGRSDMKEIWPH